MKPSAGQWRLVVVTSNVEERVGQETPVAGVLIIGRDQACDIALADPSVSRRHASIEPYGTSIRVVDLGSGNGVWVDGRRVDESMLVAGQQFRIGATVFECVAPAPVLVSAGVSSDVPTTYIERPGALPGVAEGIVRRPFVVRIIEGNEQGKEILVEDGAATVGRAADSTVVLTGRDVSRRHARIESTADGFLVTDAGSSYGLWVGTTEVKSYLLRPGETFRLGQSVVLECAYAAPEVQSPDATRYIAMAPPAPIEASSVAAEAPPAQPSVPEVEPIPPMPAPSAAAPAPEPVRPAAPPARTVTAAVPPAPIPSQVTDEDFSHTVVMPIPASLRAPLVAAAAKRIEDEGELIDLLAHKPLLLQDPNDAYYVVTGGVLIFTVTLENGEAIGTRTHFLGIVPGQCFFGFEPQVVGTGSGFLAVAKQGTKVRRIARDRVIEVARSAEQRQAMAGLLDAWIGGLSRALTDGVALKPAIDIRLKAGERVEIPPGKKASAADGILWVEMWSGSFMFDDLATPTFSRRRVLFPVASTSWLEPLGAEFGAVNVTPLSTADALADPDAWQGLNVFQEALRESEFINKRLATVDEAQRLDSKKEESEAASRAGYDAIGSVLRTEASTPLEFRATSSAEAVFRAAKLIGERLGIDVRQPIWSDEDVVPFEDRVAQIASTSGFRTRVVALREEWWRRDSGALLSQFAETKEPVALLPEGPAAYVAVAGNRPPQRVTAELAATLSGFAYAFYRPLPDGQLRTSDVIKFGARGLSKDIRWVVAMAAVVGLAGTITPWLTGKVFDSAIPEADRNALYGIGAALLASAIATSLFKLTQGIATIRIQTRMSSTIQAAVWDRMMNLPVNFFRKFSAGDLADRAAGVEAIQELIAGAGVAAVLGSISGLFYVVQMFGYNMRLALLAIVLTIVYVGFNMGANYAQLRSQRREIQLRGRITGLVLNLVSGVSKLRISGAEQHAFRVWAQQFSEQRKITFRTGTIQNVATVFASVYPILSSIAIFLIVISEQARVAGTQERGLTTGEFIAFNAAFGLFLAAMQALGDASLSLLRVVPIYERLVPILETPPEVDRSKVFPGKLTGAIELSHVNFRYDADGPFIVKDVSLKIQPGEFVAFVGSSGCGKSTLMRLMLGFEYPTSGAIYYDGQDLPSLDLRMVRQQMGVVMQQSRVMPTEIYRNIIGASSRSIEDAWDAAEKAGLAEDVRNMPMGMHTYVSEGGGTLSGGQRQRLMIARAIVNKPKIIFLDEATSALDNRTQAIVTESMDKMDATRIVIAHRLSTIQNAHRICYLHGGQIMEMGSYDELMAKNGLFAELARRQMA